MFFLCCRKLNGMKAGVFRRCVNYLRLHTTFSTGQLAFSTLVYTVLRGQGNSIMVSASVCQSGRPGSRPVQFACFRRVVCYQNVINLSPPVGKTGSPKTAPVLLCLCNNACKRSLAICRKSRALCPVSRLLSVPI